MLKYIIKRVLWMIPIILGVLLIVFTISYFTPGDPVKAILGTGYTPEAYAEKRLELGLDQPFFVQFVNYVIDLLHGDMGVSYIYGHSVAGEIATRVGITLKIGVMGVIVTAALGIPAGIISATHQYSVLDSSVTVISLIFAGMPGFWLALVSVLLFSLTLRWLPATGLEHWYSYILPVLANALPSVANVARMARSSTLEVIRMDYIRTARAKGLKEGVVIRRHVLKNALVPVVTVVGMQMGFVMAGSVIVESIFSIPGLGSYMMTGINNRDYPVINATVLVLAISVCVMNLLVDIAYAYIDPRIKAQYENTSKRKKKIQAIKAEEASK